MKLPLSRVEWWLALLVLVAGGYFYSEARDNQLARYNVILAFVEPGTGDFLTFHMDERLFPTTAGPNTIDWARRPAHDPHYYSNKAPGTILFGIVAYLPLYWGERALGLDPTGKLATLLNLYLVHLAVTLLPLAVALVCFHRLARQLLGSERRAVGLAVILALATLCLPFATQLWGHVSAAACLTIALYAAAREPRAPAWIAGSWGALAVLLDYTSALGVALLGVYLMVHRRTWRDLAGYALGGLPGLAVLLLYHWHCFGLPLTSAATHSNPQFVQPELALGLFGGMRWAALWGLTGSPFRGLFVYMPVLLPALVALAWLRWRRGQALYWLCAAQALGYLVLTASFSGWHGGASSGPRYLIVALPGWVLLLGLLPARRGWQWAQGGLALLSAGNMLAIAAVSTLAREDEPNPLPRLWRGLWQGLLRPHGLAALEHPRVPRALSLESASFSWGEWLGLSGHLALAPWLLLVGICLWRLWRHTRGDAPAPPSATACAADEA